VYVFLDNGAYRLGPLNSQNRSDDIVGFQQDSYFGWILYDYNNVPFASSVPVIGPAPYFDSNRPERSGWLLDPYTGAASDRGVTVFGLEINKTSLDVFGGFDKDGNALTATVPNDFIVFTVYLPPNLFDPTPQRDALPYPYYITLHNLIVTLRPGAGAISRSYRQGRSDLYRLPVREFELVGGGGGDVPPPPPVAAAASLALDAHRRPLAVLMPPGASAGISTAHSNDEGHVFALGNAFGGSDPSLLVDTHRNTYRIIHDTGAALTAAFGAIQDGFAADARSPASIAGMSGTAGVSGKYPAAAQHPADAGYALLAYLDGGALKTAWSGDAGQTWRPMGTAATGLDFSASGRPALCWLGEAAFLAYGSGAALALRQSPDRGRTWGPPVTVANAPANTNFASVAYSGLSLLGWKGRLYLLAWSLGTGTNLTPTLFVSPDLGASWAPHGSLPPGLAPPTALGVIPHSGQLRLGITHHSDDDGAAWQAN
jgi:hypothetical protein